MKRCCSRFVQATHHTSISRKQASNEQKQPKGTVRLCDMTSMMKSEVSHSSAHIVTRPRSLSCNTPPSPLLIRNPRGNVCAGSREREHDVSVAREVLNTLKYNFIKMRDVTTLTVPTHT